MRLQRQSNGQFITLDPASTVGVGGEARIYAVHGQSPSLLAKIYHNPTDSRARKLAVMLDNPPDDPMVSRYGQVSIAWPIDLLRTVDSRIAGFLMPHVAEARHIIDFYNPKARRQHCPSFNYRYLLHAARNLAVAIHALHVRGYVIGDVKESNTLVTNTALVTLIDTDSFQVRDPQSDVIYRCPVGTPEYTPPELQGKTFAHIDRAPEHDLFGLAVLIFQLLMEGIHPYAGIFQGSGDPPPYEGRISAGHFPYSRGRRVPYKPARSAPPFEILHPSLQQLFVRCFEDGHNNPQARPDARTWQNALDEAENALVTCSINTQHRYGSHLKTCPWCERAALLGGRDPFPSQQTGQRPQPTPPAGRPVIVPTRIPTPTVRPAPVKHNVWSLVALVLTLSLFASLYLSILLVGRMGMAYIWAAGVVAIICGVVGQRRARMLAGRGKRMGIFAMAVSGLAIMLVNCLINSLTNSGLMTSQPSA